MNSSVNDVGYTCQITAAFRAVELEHVTDPIIRDFLATHMAGGAVPTAFKDWQQLVACQGPRKSLRVPARNRIMDDLLVQALQQNKLQDDHQVQVVNLGCGMDTKPWRLQLPMANVLWYDVDQPAVLQLKEQLLQSAGAEVAAFAGPDSSRLPSDSSLACHTRQAAVQGSDHVSSPKLEQQQQRPQCSYPLLVNHWQPVAADLAAVPLAECLQATGFQHDCCTVWLAEALLYYLPLKSACELLHAMHQLSGAGSRLIATCIDKELQLAHQGLSQDHYFASTKVSWYFSMDELQQGVLQSSGWQVQMPPRTTAELALEWYGRETYIAAYGGAECCFTAVLA